MVTINAATALQQNSTTGSLQTGKYADFVVLSKDIFKVSKAEIDTAEVLVTVMNGDRTYGFKIFESIHWTSQHSGLGSTILHELRLRLRFVYKYELHCSPPCFIFKVGLHRTIPI